MRAVGAVVIVAMGAACGPISSPSSPLIPGGPDPAGVLRLFGRLGGAHACPVGPTVALTAAHVVDPHWWDNTVHPLPMRYSDGRGNGGILLPIMVDRSRDLAAMTPQGKPFEVWYPIVASAPALGERVWAFGYDFRRERNAYAPRTFLMGVLRTVATHVVLAPAVASGTSGSCVLNSRGETVAIIAWGLSTEDGGQAVGAVGVWGETFENTKGR